MAEPDTPQDQHGEQDAQSAVATGKLIQTAIVAAVIIAAALAGFDYWRKKYGPKDAGAAPAPDPDRRLYEPPPLPEVAAEDITLDLGEDVKMEFVYVPALRIWVGKYEVTNEQYRRFKPGHKVGEFRSHSLDGPRHPAVKVDLPAAREYIAWMNGLCLDALPPGRQVRLISEVEALALLSCGDDRTYPWGSDWPPPTNWNYHGIESAGPVPKIEEHRDKWPATCPVDESGKNDWGLYGVSDNVQEWTSMARGAAMKRRTYDLMGASWYYGSQDYLRCGHLPKLGIKYSTYYVGMRLAIGPPERRYIPR